MKKLFLILMMLSSLFAASNEQIINFFKKIPDFTNAKVSILSRQKLENSNFEAINVRISTSKYNNLDELIFVNGDLLSTDLINLKTMTSYSAKFREEQARKAQKSFDKKALALLKNEKMVISLGDSKKPVLYVFSDPQCPYCKKFLANVEEELKTNSLKYIITSVHGDPGYKRVAQLYKAIKGAKTTQEKITVLKNYYSSEPKDVVSVSKDQIQAAKDLFLKYNKIGLNAVPTVVDPKAL